MKPDWDKLAIESHPSVFIADVNCSDEAELCKENGVQGYPTIKVYTDGEEAPYSGGRSFEETFSFVDENLAVKCNASQPSTCSAKAQKYIEKWRRGDVEKEIARLQGMIGRDMTLELKRWLKERLNILKQISSDAPEL
jgi:thioredoxin-like negative regulator of GroEL